MKKNIPYLIYIGLLFGQLLLGCKKQEFADQAVNKIVSLEITGTTLPGDTLEFVKNGKILVQAGSPTGSFALFTKVSLEAESAEIQVRRKRDQVVIASKVITGDVYHQVMTCYYDGQQVYDTLVNLEIKGYSGADELEFMLDGVLVGSGTGTKFPGLKVALNKDKKRQVQIRKKGTPKILLDYEVLANVPLQKLVFYYDGVQLLDKIELGTPLNPANMLISALFKSSLTMFTGPVDLVFHKGYMYDPSYSYNPTDLRVPLNSDGTFSKNFELPALSPEDVTAKLKYGYKLVKRGTGIELPYDITNEFKPIIQASGFYNSPLEFTAGAAMILVITDGKTVKTTGSSLTKGTTFTVKSTDISAYFKP